MVIPLMFPKVPRSSLKILKGSPVTPPLFHTYKVEVARQQRAPRRPRSYDAGGVGFFFLGRNHIQTYPKDPGMVYLDTFGWFLWQM